MIWTAASTGSASASCPSAGALRRVSGHRTWGMWGWGPGGVGPEGMWGRGRCGAQHVQRAGLGHRPGGTAGPVGSGGGHGWLQLLPWHQAVLTRCPLLQTRRPGMKHAACCTRAGAARHQGHRGARPSGSRGPAAQPPAPSPATRMSPPHLASAPTLPHLPWDPSILTLTLTLIRAATSATPSQVCGAGVGGVTGHTEPTGACWG